MLVDGAVQIAPLAADLDIGFIDPDGTIMGLLTPAQPLLNHPRIGHP